MATKGSHRDLSMAIGQALQHQQSGNLKVAKAGYSEILRQDPNNADALHRLGCLYDEMGNTSQAIKFLVRAVKANPTVHSYFYNLANMQFRQGDAKEAIRHYREAIRLKPDYSPAHNNLGLALTRAGRRDEAKMCFREAIRHKENYADPHYNLGIELRAEGNLDDAEAAFLAAVKIKPDFADAHCNLGGTYLQMQRVSEAMAAYANAAMIQPRAARNHTNLGGAMLRLGRQQEAIASFETALQLDPMDAFTRSNMIVATSYVAANAAPLHQQCAKWDQVHGFPLRKATKPHLNQPNPARRLRIGYISADFRSHAAAYWIEPLLAGFRHEDFDIYCYSNNAVTDAITERMKQYADTWVDCFAMTDDALDARIRRDAIDILVDLSSHTEGHRLLVFVRQPAPVQVSWFGFPVSTGLQAIQYRFTDAVLDPPGQSEQFHSEKLVRLNRFYAAFMPDAAAPAIVGAGPVKKNNFITFASLNSLAKITRPMLDLWADILCEVPDSRLLFQSAGLEGDDIAESVRQLFAQRGVAPHRLTLRGWSGINEFLQIGNDVDIALDPFPFSGGVTTCHVLWTGVPVVTMSGESAASRVGASILGRVELAELVATDSVSYRAVAVRLANDRNRLAKLRSSLRTRMETGGLLDGAGLATEAGAAYRAMWRDWCFNTVK